MSLLNLNSLHASTLHQHNILNNAPITPPPPSHHPLLTTTQPNPASNPDALNDLQFLHTWPHNTYAPQTWGFTIYRAIFSPGSDERFTKGISRLENWIRFTVRQRRYDRFGEYTDLPSDPDTDATNILAGRLWNEVVEEYPDRDKVKTVVMDDGSDEGSEDFAAVGRAFVRWAEELGVDLSRRNVRYDHCLIVDEATLRMLEALPGEVPEAKPRPLGTQEWRDLVDIGKGPWVWILDRETIMAREAGMMRKEEGDIYPPWIRIRLFRLYTLWFYRAQGLVPESWWHVVEEDRVKYDRCLLVE